MARDIPIKKFSTLVIEPEAGVDVSLNPIIFLHGFMGSKELWHDIPQIICNKTKRKGYVYDARNHGDSEWKDMFSFVMASDDLKYFMDSNNIPRAILIGHSMGGWAATRVAMKWPEKVELAIIEDVVFGKIPKHFIDATIGFLYLWDAAVRKIPLNTPNKAAIKFAVDYFYSLIPPEKRKNLSPKEIMYDCDYKFHQNIKGGYEVKVNIESIKKYAKKWDLLTCPPEGTFEGPACFIYGDLSMFKIENDVDIRKHFPNMDLVVIENATHNVHMDQKQKYVDVVLNYISKHN